MKPRHLIYLLAALAATPSPLHAQDVAWTTCQGRTVASFVNVGVLGSDSAQEILRHEEVHRRQATDSIAHRGNCPYDLTPVQFVALEAEAYCASDSVRVRVKQTPAFEVSAISLARLLTQFYPTVSADTIVVIWKRTCP